MSLYDERCTTTGEWLGDATWEECLWDEFPSAGGDLEIEEDTATLFTKIPYEIGEKIHFDLTDEFYAKVVGIFREEEDDEYATITLELVIK